MANSGTTTYPATLDAFDNPGTATLEDSAGYGHFALHSQVHDAAEALETTVGTTAGTNVLMNFAAGQFPVRNTGGGATGTVVQTLVGGTLANTVLIGTPTITGGTANSVTLGTPSLVLGADAQGDIFYRGASALSRLAAGVSGQFLKTQGTGANPTWDTGVISTKTGNTTRDISTTGTQTISGVGFTSKAIFLIAEITGVTGASWGFTDTSSADLVILQDHAGNMNVDVSSNIILNLYTGAGTNAYAGVSAIGTDGFDLTWAKNSTPTGTANLIYLCLG